MTRERLAAGTPVSRLKICCIKNVAEAQLAAAYGATSIGLVSRMPSGPGVISDALAQDICREAPPSLRTVLLTQHSSADLVVEQIRNVQARAIQLVHPLAPDEVRKITDNSDGI